MDNKNNKKIEEAIFLTTVAMEAMKVPEDEIFVTNLQLQRKMLLHEDTLLPAIIGISNLMGKKLLNLDQYYDCVYPIELQKKEEALCFAEIVECDCENYTPKSLRLLITMEVIENIFTPRLDNKMDITNLVKGWRDTLADLKEGQTIDLEKFYDELVVENLRKLTLNNRFDFKN